MANESYSRMVVAHSNQVTPSGVTAVVISGFTTQTGFGAGNLEYEDPWTIMRTATVTTEPIIEHQFASSIRNRILGIINNYLATAD